MQDALHNQHDFCETSRTLSLLEAAKFLGLHKESVRRLAVCSEVPAAKLGRSWRFLEQDLVTYVRSLYANGASQSVLHNRSKTWHSTSEKKYIGLTSVTTGKEYNAALGRATK